MKYQLKLNEDEIWNGNVDDSFLQEVQHADLSRRAVMLILYRILQNGNQPTKSFEIKAILDVADFFGHDENEVCGSDFDKAKIYLQATGFIKLEPEGLVLTTKGLSVAAIES